MRGLFFKRIFLATNVFSFSFVLFLSTFSVQAAVSTPDHPLHIVMLDACFLPKSMEFLKDQHILVELITSAQPLLKHSFDKTICEKYYQNAVGKNGSVKKIHPYFIGDKLENKLELNRVLDRITKKHGKVDLVISEASDLATYMSNFAREHLGIEPASWEIGCSDCFYDKLVMKSQLLKKAPQIKTAPFIAFDADPDRVKAFVTKLGFPLILKKRRSAGAVGIEVIENQKDFQKLYSKVKDKDNYLLERFITGKIIRIGGERVNGFTTTLIAATNRTSPLEHFLNGKSKIAITTDESEISQAKIKAFTDDTLQALELKTGPYHLEAIHSETDGELYFLEVAARPAHANVSEVYRDLLNYDQDSAFLFRQFPKSYWNSKQEMETLQKRLFVDPMSQPKNGDVYAVIAYTFLPSTQYSFQSVVTNIHPSALKEITADMKIKTLRHCNFDKKIENADPGTLATQGISVFRFPFEIGIKALSCQFVGPKEEVEKDLRKWEQVTQFKTNPIHRILNRMVPRGLFSAGGI